MNNLPESIAGEKQELQNAPKQKQTKKHAHENSMFGQYGVTIAAITFVILAAVCLYLLSGSIKIGAAAMADSYNLAYIAEKDAAYQKLYKNAFDRAKENYHVSNTVVISIGNLEETAKLELLKANDVEFITENREDNSGHVTAWLEVSGEGTFVVDLKAAEFIIDNERRHVLVRTPKPELTNIEITGAKSRLFKDGILNGSYGEGVNLALKQRREAALRIQKALISNQYIYNAAQTVARNTITNLVRQFNPDIPDLTVDVAFMGE